MSEQQEAKKPVPPYVAYKTFRSFLDGLRVEVPGRIDRSVMRSLSGATQNALMSTLRYLPLLNADTSPNASLIALARSGDADRKKHFQDIVRRGYPFLFDGSLNLQNATSTQLAEAFRNQGTSGETTEKCIALFTALAKGADLKLSPFLKAKRGPRPGSTRKPRTTGSGGTPNPMTPPITPPPAPAKSAQDLLLAMLSPEEMNAEEQKAVWTLLLYLKKKPGGAE
jgi:hypothetical protein